MFEEEDEEDDDDEGAAVHLEMGKVEPTIGDRFAIAVCATVVSGSLRAEEAGESGGECGGEGASFIVSCEGWTLSEEGVVTTGGLGFVVTLSELGFRGVLLFFVSFPVSTVTVMFSFVCCLISGLLFWYQWFGDGPFAFGEPHKHRKMKVTRSALRPILGVLSSFLSRECK